MEADLLFSLGPNCRNAWNLRHHFGIQRAYPFDWWVTPAGSMLRLLERSQAFNVTRKDLVLAEPSPDNTVYNRNYHILHHHDFPREDGIVWRIDDEDIQALNAKYRSLFARMHADIDAASHPVAVLNGIEGQMPPAPDYPGFEYDRDLDRFITPDDLAREVRLRLGNKVRLFIIDIDDRDAVHEHEWGCRVQVKDPKQPSGLPPGHFAEPVAAFARAYERVGLTLRR